MKRTAKKPERRVPAPTCADLKVQIVASPLFGHAVLIQDGRGQRVFYRPVVRVQA